MRGNNDALEQLVKYPMLDIEGNMDSEDTSGVSPLHMAVTYGHSDSARYLLSYYKLFYISLFNFRILIDAGAKVLRPDEKGQTSLHKACTLNTTEVVKLILKTVEDKFGNQSIESFLEKEDCDKTTALMISVESGNWEITKLLIEAGAKINTVNSGGFTPLHLAALHGSSDVANILIENGAEIDAVNHDGQTPLHVASSNVCIKMIKILVDHGANLEKPDKNGSTALLLAAKAGQSDILKEIIKLGGEIDTIDKDDHSPLYFTVERNHLKCLKTLLKSSKAEVLLCRNDRWDNTPLHIAAAKG